MDTDQILMHAINLIEAGNKTDGRELLRQTVQAEPFNADAWYIYAQFCGKRDQAIYALEHVLKLDPDYPGARDALEKIAPETPLPADLPAPQPAFIPLEQDDPWKQSLQADPDTTPIIPGAIPTKKKKGTRVPKWFIAVAAGMLGCLVFAGLAIGALLLSGKTQSARAETVPSPVKIVAQPNTPIPSPVIQPYQTPTTTPDPCTCEAVNLYMTNHLARVNQLLSEMDFVTKKLNKKSLKEQDTLTLVQNATQMYDAQRAEEFPPCLASYQKDAVKMFWNWQQAVTAIQNGETNSALAFMEIISTDSGQLDVKLTKLSNYPTLQSCTFAFPTLIAP